MLIVWTKVTWAQKSTRPVSPPRLRDKSPLLWVWLWPCASSYSVPSPPLNLSWNTLSIPVPQEPEPHLAFVSPHPSKTFLTRIQVPWEQRAESSACLFTEVTQAPSTVPGTQEALDNVCLLKRLRSCSWIPGWLVTTLLPVRYSFPLSSLKARSKLLGIPYKLPESPSAKWFPESDLLL